MPEGDDDGGRRLVAVTAREMRDQILALYEREGVKEVGEIARRVKGARPSYVAHVLQQAGHLTEYDLTLRCGDIYTRYFRKALDTSSVEAARASVAHIERTFNYFERLGDRVGQENALTVALICASRASRAGRADAAAVFGDWLVAHVTTTPRAEDTHAASLRFAMLLKVAFPWLGTDEEAGSSADMIARLREIYDALIANDADRMGEEKGGGI